MLRRLGVTVRTGTKVTDIREDGVTVTDSRGTEQIPARTVLWAAGVQASPLGRVLEARAGASLDRGGRVIAEPDLSLPGHPEILVIGDLAHLNDPDGKPVPGVAPAAMQQGRYAAELIRRRLRGESLPAFRYQDKGSLATIGRAAAVADFGRLRLHGFLAWVIWLFIHLLYIVAFESRLLILDPVGVELLHPQPRRTPDHGQRHPAAGWRGGSEPTPSARQLTGIGYGLQPGAIGDDDPVPVELDQPVVRQIAQRAADHLAHGAQPRGHLCLCHHLVALYGAPCR